MGNSTVGSTRARLVAYTTSLIVGASLICLLWHHPWKTIVGSSLVALLCVIVATALLPSVWRRSSEEPPAAEADLDRRRRVWEVLSELYLDTELDDRDNERIAAVLVASGYSVGQLEEILYREIHPVLRANLLSVAGEWTGFDLSWIEEQILRRRPRRSSVAFIPGKWLVRNAWAAIEAKIRGSRA